MEERSRELFTMLRCVIHHQCNTERSGDGRKVREAGFLKNGFFVTLHFPSKAGSRKILGFRFLKKV
jgi:hypothetical protein